MCTSLIPMEKFSAKTTKINNHHTKSNPLKLTTIINSKHKDCNPKTKKEQNPQQKLLPTKNTTESPATNNVEKNTLSPNKNQ